MNHQKQNTRERILAVALDLFCVNGYTTVSVRDIGKAVGIKESSIYYHFKDKEEILQTILQQAEQYTLVMKSSFMHALSSVTKVERDKFIAAGISYIENFLIEETIYKLIRMLTIEKQRNEKAAEIYHQLLFTTPLEHHNNVFSYLAEKGYLKKDSNECLAAEYQAIILFIFQKYFSNPNTVMTAAKQDARKELTELLNRFYQHYLCEEVSPE